jgi:hypothetical protein
MFVVPLPSFVFSLSSFEVSIRRHDTWGNPVYYLLLLLFSFVAFQKKQQAKKEMIRRGRKSSSILTSFPVVIGLIIIVCIFLNERYVLSHRSRYESSGGDAPKDEQRPPPIVGMAKQNENIETNQPHGVSDGVETLAAVDKKGAVVPDQHDDNENEEIASSSSDSSDALPAAGGAASSTSPYTMKSWLEYEDVVSCPKWAFGDPPHDSDNGSQEPWMNPLPRTAIHHFGGSECRAEVDGKVRVVFAGLRGKEGYGDDEDMDKIMNWRDREALRRSREEHHNELMSELRLQLRCRIAGVKVIEVEDDEDNTDRSTTKFIFHPMPKDEVKSVGLHAAHKIVVSHGVVSLWAGTREAVAHAVTALLYMFMDKNITSSYGSSHGSFQWMSMPPVDLSRHRSGSLSLVCGGYDGFDGAALSYRGLLVDVARHFLPVNELLRIMHVMSLLKLNVLHLHLSDDQGWRLVVSDFPELAEFGARRGKNANPTSSKYSSMGIRGDNAEPEVYSVADTRSLRRAARLLHITLIPEIDVPAHSAALLRSAAAARNSQGDERGLGRLRGVVEVHEGCVEETNVAACSEHSSQMKCPNKLAVNCMGGTHGLIVPTAGSVDVVKRLLDVTLQRHFPQTPYVHLGGDETVQFQKSSIMTPAVRDELAELWGRGEYVTLPQAHGHFLQSLRNYVEHHHYRTAIVWDDSASFITESLQKELKSNRAAAAPVASSDVAVADNNLPVVQWWRDWHEEGRWQSFRDTPVLKILSPTSNTYFDASQHANRSKDVFPVQDGTVTIDDVWRLAEKLTSPEAHRILGIEGCLWSETLVNTTVLWYQLLPRLSALANVAWSGGELATKQSRDVVAAGATYEHATMKLQLHINATLHFTPLVIIH